ncbi:hypothetical protein A2870_04675 [Candidatus Curtissbacteria bacterium RIFCSPHIGHO2_01_FULL_41_11]|uniref:Uncharacterized protein n=1 Tax=Candidatus Curtissbacteria bacterium RIFCSPHIGHO2_01_FULL_41_11 TaxID=1797711 RepID=A0A1F5G793_9BACT|nr:MAG: hypothetical protein A2870_04675 [Candidatus Curtissbacteria bacterium RIFCSPHIGHO2_01_FULL_41_11]
MFNHVINTGGLLIGHLHDHYGKDWVYFDMTKDSTGETHKFKDPKTSKIVTKKVVSTTEDGFKVGFELLLKDIINGKIEDKVYQMKGE